MQEFCDVCRAVLLRRPHVMLVGVTPATTGNRIGVCDSCYEKLETVRRTLNERKEDNR